MGKEHLWWENQRWPSQKKRRNEPISILGIYLDFNGRGGATGPILRMFIHRLLEAILKPPSEFSISLGDAPWISMGFTWDFHGFLVARTWRELWDSVYIHQVSLLGNFEYFTNLNSSAIKVDDFPIKTNVSQWGHNNLPRHFQNHQPISAQWSQWCDDLESWSIPMIIPMIAKLVYNSNNYGLWYI